jgi:hypothetical protein
MKLSPQQAELLELLADGCWHTNSELNAHMYRYGGRIMELRAMGYQIETDGVKRGLFRYRLVAPVRRPPTPIAQRESLRALAAQDSPPRRACTPPAPQRRRAVMPASGSMRALTSTPQPGPIDGQGELPWA